VPEVLHQRRQIRDAVVAALKAADTAAGERVFPARSNPFKRVDLPAVAVLTSSETSDDGQTAPRELKRVMRLEVQAAVEDTANVQDVLDALALQLERAMHADPTFGGVCADSTLTESSLLVDGQTGQREVGALGLAYRVTYYTDSPAATDVTLVDLKTVDAKTSLGGTQAAADQMEDRVDGLDE
jgi:hypothetical protein